MKPVTEIIQKLGELHLEGNKRYWTLYTSGFDFGVQEINDKIDDYLKDKENFKVVSDYRESDLFGVERRGADLLFEEFKWHHLSEKAVKLHKEINQLQTKLSDIQNKHRIRLKGKEYTSSQIGEILVKNSDQHERREAYLSRTQINKKLIDGGFLKLLDLRKEYALACDRENFVSLMLEKDELSSEIFEPWIAECSSRSGVLNEKECRIAQSVLKKDKIDPWDYSYIKELLCSYYTHQVDMINFIEPVKSVFKSNGFDIEGLNITFDIFSRKNKSEWGYNFTIDPGVDSRVLANVSGRFYDYWVLLHETAHGVHFLGLNKDEKLINRGVSGIVAEGFANFFGNLAYSKEFLKEIFENSYEEAYTDFKGLISFSDLRVFDLMNQTIFDQRLYLSQLSSKGDVEKLVWNTRKELLGKDPYSDEPVWGHLIHHTSAPIYLHNYFLGDVLCEKMKDVFKSQNGRDWASDPEGFGHFWKNQVLAPSGRHSFPELYEKVCGEKVSIGSYLDKCLRYDG